MLFRKKAAAPALDPGNIPPHIAVILDGNGRWAQKRGLPRTAGHSAGSETFQRAAEHLADLGVEYFTVYAFSTENWKRPQEEVNMLMHLFATTLLHELPLFHQENVRLRFFGDLEALPEETRKVFQQGLDETAANTGMTFALAVNYGSRAELARAARVLAQRVQDGELDASAIDENALASELYTAGLSDPDLLIRTSGELRLSNYLLWQLAYTEFYVTPTFWPDFSRWEFLRAIKSFQGRKRRFGGVVNS